MNEPPGLWLFGDGTLTELIASGLQMASMPFVRVCSAGDVSLDLPTPSLIIIVSDTWNPEWEQSALHAARQSGAKILSVLGRSQRILVGPVETPGRHGCMECLNLRWTHSLKRATLMKHIDRNQGNHASLNLPLALTTSRRVALLTLIMKRIKNALTGHELSTKDVAVFHATLHEVSWHELLPSSNCKRCTELQLSDGSVDSAWKEQSLEDAEHLRVHKLSSSKIQSMFLHPDIGYVSAVQTVWQHSGVYGVQAAIQWSPSNMLRGSGIGFSVEEATTSAILEAAERACGRVLSPLQRVVKGTYNDLHNSAVHPLKFGLHDDETYDSDTKLMRFREDSEYMWVEGYALSTGQKVLVPAQVVHHGMVPDGERRFVFVSSSGAAVGTTLAEAVLYSALEVLERDSFLNTWYGRIPLGKLAMDGAHPVEIDYLIAAIANAGFQVHLLDMSHDLLMFSVLAIATRTENEAPKTLCAASAHLLPYPAVVGALRELLAHAVYLSRKFRDESVYRDAMEKLDNPRQMTKVHDHAIVAALPNASRWWNFLLDNVSSKPTITMHERYQETKEMFQLESRDMSIILHALCAYLAERGFDVLVVDVTNLELRNAGLWAARVLIPGLTPMTFGFGRRRVKGLTRVTELPWRMGYANQPLIYEDLNKHPHPFP